MTEAREELVPASVLQSYDYAFQQALGQLIQRTEDPALRERFRAMLDCPIRDARGNCHTFAEYILNAMVRNNVHRGYDIEAALGYVVQQMLLDKTFAGQPRATLFSGLDATQPKSPDTNPLLGRFLTYLSYAIKNIVGGRIPRLSNRARMQKGVLAFGQGQRAAIDPNEVPAPHSQDQEMAELVADITTMLQDKERASGLPLTAIFQTIMAGQRTDQQVNQFGDRPTRTMRKIIKDTIREFAHSTGNYQLLHLLQRIEGIEPSRTTPTHQPLKPLIAALSPKDKDFRSIVSVVAQFDRPVGMADLGRYRRRWLEYPPRTPNSQFRNRLEEVLDLMVRENVLQAHRSLRGAVVYSRGQNFGQYQSRASA